MKSKKSQQGSAHLIIIIILVIGLLGTVGYIAWQRFSKVNEPVVATEPTESTTDKTPPEETPATTETPTTNTTETPAASAKTGKENLAITQWGVTGYYAGSISINYVISNSTHLDFMSSDLTGGCIDKPIGSINRLIGTDTYPGVGITDTIAQVFSTGSSQMKNTIKHIGNYYYVYASPQASCDANLLSTLRTIDSDLANYFNTLVAI